MRQAARAAARLARTRSEVVRSRGPRPSRNHAHQSLGRGTRSTNPQPPPRGGRWTGARGADPWGRGTCHMQIDRRRPPGPPPPQAANRAAAPDPQPRLRGFAHDAPCRGARAPEPRGTRPPPRCDWPPTKARDHGHRPVRTAAGTGSPPSTHGPFGRPRPALALTHVARRARPSGTAATAQTAPRQTTEAYARASTRGCPGTTGGRAGGSVPRRVA